MPSALDAMFLPFVPGTLQLMGESIAIIPHGSSQRSILAIVHRDTRTAVDEFEIRNVYNTIEIEISARNDVEGRVTPAELRHGGDFDKFVFDGLTWGLQRVKLRNVAGRHHLILFDGGKTPT